MTLPDDRHAKLLTQLLLSTGASVDMLPTWLKSELIVKDDASTVTLWHRYWDEQGIIGGSFTSRATAWLGSLGHVGNDLQARWASYWATPAVAGVPLGCPQ